MQTKKVGYFVCLVLVMLVIMTACKPNERVEEPQPQETIGESTPTPAPAKDYPVEVSLGEEMVTIVEKPKKIVALTPDLAEAILDMGLEKLLVGVGEGCEEFKGLETIEFCGNPLVADLDKIRELQPDLVLTSSPMRPEQMEPLFEMNAQVLTFPQAETFDAIHARIEALNKILYGETLGTQKGASAVREYTEKLEDVTKPAQSYLTTVGTKVKAVYIGALPYTLATGDTFEGQMLEQIGLENLAASGTAWVYHPTEEEPLNPDIIFYDGSIPAEEILQSDAYKNSSAVAYQQVYPIDFTKIRRKNLSMIEELQSMASKAYPNAY